MEPIIYISLGFFAGTAITGALLGLRLFQLSKAKTTLQANIEAIENAQSSIESHFKVTAQEALKNAHESFLELADARLKNAHKDSAHDLEKRQKAIDELVKPVHENLKALSGALEQVKGTDKALREDLNTLNRETAKLVGALRDPAGQGQWGEFILEGLLDKSGLIKGVHYETQVSMQTTEGRQRPDAVIRMQDGFNIIVDSKAPLNEFAQRLSEDLSEQEHNQIMQNLSRQVREHVKQLSQKGYWENVESPDFTVMFLPSEHLYSVALRADPTIVEFAASRDIIIASPTLLMSLLRVVGMSWRQVELAQNAQEISERGFELYKRFLKFTDHFEKIGKGLQSAMSGYDSAIGSMERQVLPAARKFSELQSAKTSIESMPDMQKIEQEPRQISLTDQDEKQKKSA